ncbi:HLH multi-domain protein [Venturia nashicola]|uniref:HLH multi-domain protein n=1 Tax=Venturia nashicola TaxID=86259 RepID=A0A4Z1P9A3_9PEZI|nr:HLH multi-domain protein [Venturia nashicola]
MSPTALPTPAPSTEILPGKRVNSLTGQIDAAFALPPAAIANCNSDTTSVQSLSPVNSDSSYRPLSPPSIPSASSRAEKAPTASRKKTSAAASQAHASNQDGYTIPPPPTRSRKIIQMKPRGQAEAQDENLDLAKNHPAIAPSSQVTDTKTATAAAAAAGSKRKQSGSGGPTTAAGRKIARKTAHSLIERRRRSKMNEEFGVLKSMIPACNGSDMHKLAILQASIEYMSYLEKCLADLKSAHSHCQPTAYQHRQQAPFRATPYSDAPTAGSALAEQLDEDEEMEEACSPHSMRPRGSTTASITNYSHQPSISPAILPSSHTSPLITTNHRSSYSYYSANSSAVTSPAFEPQAKAGGPNYSTFSLTSPALAPQDRASGSVKGLEQVDQEATAALLMLNTDRRSWSGPSGARGMSVKDLLSG